MLEAILALLVSFASLADRAAGLPLSLQLPLFAFLTRGESVARSFLVDLPAGAPAFLVTSQADERAERLSADFRALARILRALLARARQRASFATCDLVLKAEPLMLPYGSECAGGCSAVAPRAPDTS